jgi:hypothetical protein
MAFVPPTRHLLRAKDLADARYFEPLGVSDLADAAGLSAPTSVASFAAPSASHRTPTRHASYEELKSRGVDFTEEPEERPYGIDSGFRDPSGNSIRLTQVQEIAAV